MKLSCGLVRSLSIGEWMSFPLGRIGGGAAIAQDQAQRGMLFMQHGGGKAGVNWGERLRVPKHIRFCLHQRQPRPRTTPPGPHRSSSDPVSTDGVVGPCGPGPRAVGREVLLEALSLPLEPFACLVPSAGKWVVRGERDRKASSWDGLKGREGEKVILG